MRYPTVLTLAGSDCSGGAGLQADLKTISQLGCYGMSVVTAVTAQNTQGVSAIHAIPVDIIEQQCAMIASDIPVDAIKTGMLFSAEIMTTISHCLQRYWPTVPVVVDPVCVAQSGDRLLTEDALSTMKTDLLPCATVITPNIAEGQALVGNTVRDEALLQSLCDLLQPEQAVLLKGGHAPGRESVDWLGWRQQRHDYRHKLDTNHQ